MAHQRAPVLDGLQAAGKLNEWKPPEQRHLLDLEALTALSTAPTLKEFSERYMARPESRPSYMARNKSLLKLHILLYLGEVRLPDMTKAMVRGWWQSLDSDKARTNDLAYQLLRAMMNAAVEDEYISENPCAVKGAGRGSKAEGPATLTPAEVWAIADNIDPRLPSPTGPGHEKRAELSKATFPPHSHGGSGLEAQTRRRKGGAGSLTQAYLGVESVVFFFENSLAIVENTA